MRLESWAARWIIVLAALAGCGSQASDRPQDNGGAGGGSSSGSGGSSAGGSGGTNTTGAGGAVAPTPWALPGTSLISDATACAHPDQVTVGPSPLRRLSRVEYNNMVRDLLGDNSQPATGFVSETKVAGFNSNTYAASQVNALINRQYLETAEALAANVSGNTLVNMLPCASRADDACATDFINDWVVRAFRGQLDNDEATNLFQIYADTKKQFDFATGIQAMIIAVLTSPRFLFVLEFGQGTGNGTAVALSQYELASRLALYLWRSVPDATLMQAATMNQLSTPDQIETQAQRMLADPKATGALQDFANQWLDIENMDAVTKDTYFALAWTPQIAKSLHNEALTTYSKLVITEKNDLTALLTSPASYVTQDLSTFYKVASVSGSDQPTMLNSSKSPRSGILTSGAFLASHAHPRLPSPVLRGKIVLANVMCRPVAPPTSIPSLAGKIPPPPSMAMPGQTTRQAFEDHQNRDTICASCHVLMDNVGFAFDAYDATGATFPQDLPDATKFDENGTAIDSTGSISGTASDLDGQSFTDAVDLTHKLAQSTLVKQCFAVQQFRYALDRAEAAGDACSLQQTYKDFSAGGFNIQKLILSIVRSDAFRARTLVHPGSACQ
jgi:hypothetical protein